MASPDGSNRKVIKAHKTKPSRCGKQVELLNKLKIDETLKTTIVENNNVPSDNQDLSTAVIQSKYRCSEDDVSSLDSSKNLLCSEKSDVFSLSLLEPVEKIDSEYVDDEVVTPYQKSGKPLYSLRKLFIEEANDSQNISANHFGNQANIPRSTFEAHEGECNLQSVCYSPKVLSGVVHVPTNTIRNALNDEGQDSRMVSYLETNSKSDSNGPNSDSCFIPDEKTPHSMNSVSSSNCTANGLKAEDCSRGCRPSISGCGSSGTTWHSSPDIDSNISHNLKKKLFSENKENVKRMKMSEQNNETITVALENQRTFLGEIQHLIRQEVYSANYKVFDSKLKELNDRIGKTQCRSKHEAIAVELFAKIAKLQRRIKTLSSQRNCLDPSMVSSNVACKQTVKSGSMILNRKQESLNGVNERLTFMTDEHSKSSGKKTKKVNLSTDHIELVSESNDDVMLITEESPNLTTSVTSNQTDTEKIKSRNSSSPDANMDIMVVEKIKVDSVIDLTQEDLPRCNTDAEVKKEPFLADPSSGCQSFGSTYEPKPHAGGFHHQVACCLFSSSLGHVGLE